MRRILLCALAALVSLPVAWADDEKKATDKTASAAAAAFNAAMAEFQKQYLPGRQKVMKDFLNAKTDAERERLLNRFSKNAEKLAERFAKVAKDYPRESAGTQAARMAQQLRLTLPRLKAQVVVAAGNALRDEYEKAYQAKGRNAQALYKKAENFFTEGAKKYTDTPLIANQLREGAYLLAKLSIGKTAPEIRGEDLDGHEFKLSDYRGKVVVLDFWGNW